MSLALNIRDVFSSNHGYQNPEQVANSEIEVETGLHARTCAIGIKRSAPLYFTQTMLLELIKFGEQGEAENSSPFRYRVLWSHKDRVFSLGGDLAFFRNCISTAAKEALTGYANSAVDSIWASLAASGRLDLFSISLVQGEAQGGGFEAAIAGHVLVAEKGASFGFPEGLFGMFPGMGARQVLAARTSREMASRIIGSARRYSAEELFNAGVVDFLAEPGDGWNLIKELCNGRNDRKLQELRDRFDSIRKFDLDEVATEWVDQVMNLSDKHLKTINYLLQAQERVRHSVASIRAV